MSQDYAPMLEEWYDKFELNADGEVQLKTTYGAYAGEISANLTIEERMQGAVDKIFDSIRFVNQ